MNGRDALMAVGQQKLYGPDNTPRKLSEDDRRAVDIVLSAVGDMDKGSTRQTAPPIAATAAAPRPVEFRNARTGGICRLYRQGTPLGATYPFEAEPLSLGRFLVGVATGRWDEAEAERRTFQAEGTNTLGGFLVPDPLWANIVDLARNRAICMRAGMQTITMDSETLKMARLTGDPTIALKGENEAWSDTNATFDQLQFVAKTYGAVLTCSEELIQDGVGVAQVLDNALQQALAVSIDSNVLTWLTTQATGTASEGSIGAIDYTHMLNAYSTVLANNAEPTAYALHPTIWTDLIGIQAAPSGVWLGAPEGVRDLTPYPTAQLTTAYGVLGDFRQLLLGLRLRPTVAISREANEAFERFQVKIRIAWRGDWNVAHASHLCILSSITT